MKDPAAIIKRNSFKLAKHYSGDPEWHLSDESIARLEKENEEASNFLSDCDCP